MEYKKTKEQLINELEKEYKDFYEHSPDMLASVDAKTAKVIKCNQTFADKTGKSKNEIIGSSIFSLITPQSLEYAKKHVFPQFVKTGEVKNEELQIIGRDGIPIDGMLSATAVRDEQGNNLYSRSSFRDISEKKMMESALRLMEDQYRTVAEDTPILICRFLPGGEISYVNNAFCKCLSKTSEELVGQIFLSLIPEANRETVRANLSVLTVESPVMSQDHPVICPDSETRWQRWTNRALFDKEGKIISYQSIGEDITERKRVEDELRIKEASIESSINAVAISDLKGNLTYVNNSFLKMWGYESVNDVLGKLAVDFWGSQKEAGKVIEELKKCGGYIGEMTAKNKNGSTFDVQLSSSMVKNDTGVPICMMASFVDVSKRMQAEEKLRKSEQLQRLLMENADDIIVMQDLNGKYLYCNSTVQYGIKAKDVIGKTPFDVHDAEKANEFMERLNGVIESGQALSCESQLYWHGENMWFSDQLSPIKDAKGNVEFVITISRNITERKRTEEQRHQSQKMEALGVLSGGIAHDFNNILGSIIGYTDMTLDTLPSESTEANNLRQINKASHRAKNLVKQILLFSQKVGQIKKLVYLYPIVREAIEFARASLLSSIEIKETLEKDTTPILANSTQILEIVMNLVSNARWAVKKRGIVDISLKEVFLSEASGVLGAFEPGWYSCLTVSDHGYGMDKAKLSRIFEPFYTTKEVGEGSGLGLSVVYGIVKDHGGNIQVESNPGAGTVFRLYFPKIEGDVESENTVSNEIPRGKEKILFVDDEEMLMEMAKDLLDSLGYTVIATTSPLKAIELFQNNPNAFDVLIADKTMPVMSGFELAKEILGIKRNIPILLISGNISSEDFEKAKIAGINDIFAKPFSINELAQKIREILDNEGRGNE